MRIRHHFIRNTVGGAGTRQRCHDDSMRKLDRTNLERLKECFVVAESHRSDSRLVDSRMISGARTAAGIL